MKLRKGMGIGMGIGYKNLIPIDPYIHSLSAKGIGTKVFPLVRVPYGRKDTPKKDREYKHQLGSSPVGTIKEWKDFAKKSDIDKLHINESDGTDFYVDVDAKGQPIATIPIKDWKKMGVSKKALLNKVAFKFGYRPEVTKKEMDYIFSTDNIKGIESRFIEVMHKRPLDLSAKSTSLVVRPVEKVIYHKGFWQNVFDDKHPKTVKNSEKQKLMMESTRLKKKIKNLLYDAESYKGEKATDHEILTITVLKDKLPHFNFLTAHTDWDATGYFKDDILDVRFDRENNAIIQIEYLDTKNEKIGKELIKSFNRLNDIEIGESLLYVRSQTVEETSLPLEEWR